VVVRIDAVHCLIRSSKYGSTALKELEDIVDGCLCPVLVRIELGNGGASVFNVLDGLQVT